MLSKKILNICFFLYADDIVLLSGSVSKLQMFKCSNSELESLDLECNTSKQGD